MSSQASAIIKLASSATEFEQCFPVISQLRTHLAADNFVRQVETQMNAGYQLVYISDREIVGVAGFNITTNLAWGKHLYVADLVVDKEKRSHGYGQRDPAVKRRGFL